MLRLAFAAALALSPVPASAETSAVSLQAWLCRLAPKAQRCRVPIPPAKPIELPSQPKPPAVPQRQAPVASPPAPRAAPVRQKAKQERKTKLEQPPLSGGGQAAQPKPGEGITCAQARQGVGMPCFMIRANSHHYDRLTPAQKRQADACLSAAERAAIKACFK